MPANDESQKEVIRPDFNQAITIDFQGAKITSDVGFLLVREVDERFRIIDPMQDCLETKFVLSCLSRDNLAAKAESS